MIAARQRPPPPAAGGAADPARRFRHWQTRTLVAAMAGYAAYYFVRNNLSVALPAIKAELGLGQTELGALLTLHGLVYGVSKFANGFLGDRADARRFMVAGLVLSAAANVLFGLGSAAWMLTAAWALNGWTQGMGLPPCARLLTHWFHPRELATRMSVWNASHSLGAALALVAGGYAAALGWRWSFFLPALAAGAVALGLWFALRDTPSSVGLPEIAPVSEAAQTPREFRRFVRRQVFANPFIWLMAGANFFVYAFRFAVLSWGPLLLTELRHVSLPDAGWMVAGFEVAGIAGMLCAGWLTDRVFGGRGARMCVFCMIGAGVSLVGFWQMSDASAAVSTALLGCAGFFIYGPQALVGIIAANLATRRAAGTAVGFTGLCGYLSTIVSGWGLGFIAEHHGWNAALATVSVAALLGAGLFACAWHAPAHGYHQEDSPERPCVADGGQVRGLAVAAAGET